MTNTTATAEYIAPLGDTVLVTPRNGFAQAPRCELEHVWFSFIDGSFLSVWVRPDSLASALKAKRALAPGKAIDESLSDSDMAELGARFLAVDGPVWEF